MTKIEQRLRRDLHAIAQQAQQEQLRPLQVPRVRPGWRERRWVAPVAAAAAVAAVLAGIYAAVHSMPSQLAAAKVTPMPPYYLDNSNGKIVTVRASATGRVLATLTAPAGRAFGPVAVAGDDRTFALTEVKGPASSHPVWEFYLLRLTADAHHTALSRLAYTVPFGSAQYAVGGLAVNADGSMLAVATYPLPDVKVGAPVPEPTRIAVVSLPTGTVVRSWAAPGKIQPSQLSWVRSGRISFTSTDTRPLPRRPAVAQLRLLDTASPSPELLAASQAVRIRQPAGSTFMSAQVTQDGHKVIAWTSVQRRDTSGGGGFLLEASMGEYSARTGRLIRGLYGQPASRSLINSVTQFSVDPSSQHVLFQAEDVYGTIIFGRVDNGKFTALPHPKGSATLVLSAW